MTVEPEVDLDSDRIMRVQWGVIYCVYCAPNSKTRQEVADYATIIDAPGTSNNCWIPSEPHERGDDWSNKVSMSCNDHPDRTHWLVNC